MNRVLRLMLPCCMAALIIPSLYAGRPGNFGQTTFNVTLTLFSEIKVEKVKDLEFGDVVMGQAKNIVVNDLSDQAAKFRANGDRNARISVKVVEESIKMKTQTSGPKHEIVVDQWNYGGNVDGNGDGHFDVNGAIQNIRVGGVAHVRADNEYGNYTGTATLRVTYL